MAGNWTLKLKRLISKNMKKMFFFISVIAIVLGIIPVLSWCQSSESYYTESKRGWWWYEVLPEKTEEKKDEEPKAVKRKLPSLSDYTKEELWNMHPDDFQALLMEFQKKAVMSPTVSNVREYYVIQDIARRKSLTFANVSSFVMQKYPELSLKADYPITQPGRVAKVSQQNADVEQKIKSSRDDFALLYFYSPECPYCKAQNGILEYFVNKYQWQIKKIDINRDPNAAARFDVQTVPYILLIYKYSKDYMPVSVGVVSLGEMEGRLYRGIRLLSGEVTPEEYSLYEFQKGGGFDTQKHLP